MMHAHRTTGMKARRAFGLLVAFALLAMTVLVPVAAQAAGTTGKSLVEGQYLTFGKYNGKPITWRVLYVSGDQALMWTDKIIALKPFDVADSTSGASTYGNYWPDSNIRQWLNATNANGTEIAYKHKKPIADYLIHRKNAYADEAGFLSVNNFTAQDYAAIVETKRTVTVPKIFVDSGAVRQESGNATLFEAPISGNESYIQIQDNNYQVSVKDRVFFLSLYEFKQLTINKLREYDMLDGYLTDDALSRYDTGKQGVTAKTVWPYWTGSPDFLGDSIVYTVDEYSDALAVGNTIKGSFYANMPAKTDTVGIRPAMYVKLSALAWQSGTGTLRDPWAAVGTTQTVKAQATFRDVSSSDWYYNDVYSAYALGLMQGTSKTEFEPEGTLTVAELLTTCLNLLETKVDASGQYNHWYDPYIAEAVKRDLLREGDAFYSNVDRPVTRAEMAVIVVRATQAVNKDLIVDRNSVDWVEDAFSDLRSIPTDYRTSVFQAYASGLLKGYDDGTFGGGNSLIRAECATVMVRIKTGNLTRPTPQ